MRIKHNKFNLSHDHKLSFDAGKLVPILVQEVLPGDNFYIAPRVFVRCQPLIAPVLNDVDVYTYFFYVQNLDIWDDAKEFYTRGRDMDSTVTVPRLSMDEENRIVIQKGELADYMGIPPIETPTQGPISGSHYINSLPFKAYQKIYQDVFRHQEVEDEWIMDTSSADITGGASWAYYQIRNRNWPKNYFTGAKAQMLLVPEVNGWVPAEPYSDEASMYKDQSEFYLRNDTLSGSNASIDQHGSTDGGLYTVSHPAGEGHVRNLQLGAQPDDYLNIGVDIDNIRRVSALQRWVEQMIRTGYRYQDYLKVIWDVVSKDHRLDRPEYLGGSSTPLRISEVLNTSATATEEQGEMAGHGIAAGSGRPIKKSFTEHGWIIGLICVVPRQSFFQGVESFWKKYDHTDYATPMFANLGKQYVKSYEIFYDWKDSETVNDANFAMQERYAEYKQKMDRISGDFREELSYWHFGSEFPVRPTFNEGFVKCTPKTSVFASSDDPYLAQIKFNMSVLRKLPVYASLKID